MGRLARCHAPHGLRWSSLPGMRALVTTTTLALIAFVVPALAHEPLPLDRQAIFMTHVHDLRSQVRGGPHAPAGPYATQAAAFTGSGYPAPLPSSIVTPTSTFPEEIGRAHV